MMRLFGHLDETEKYAARVAAGALCRQHTRQSIPLAASNQSDLANVLLSLPLMRLLVIRRMKENCTAEVGARAPFHRMDLHGAGAQVQKSQRSKTDPHDAGKEGAADTLRT
mmetsp:Transcript_6193/g.18751  ORF Transcript_6193/g.18751 Transcript_6193/m.18751 type:complete len:111 (+) Transcript_6193:2594-2926(+)